jgi:hypothetical protein
VVDKGSWFALIVRLLAQPNPIRFYKLTVLTVLMNANIGHRWRPRSTKKIIVSLLLAPSTMNYASPMIAHVHNVLPDPSLSPATRCSPYSRSFWFLLLVLSLFGLFKDVKAVAYAAISMTEIDIKAASQRELPPRIYTPPATIQQIKQRHALNLLQGKWVYLLGDSSIRMFNAATISRLNGTLEDPRFGSYITHDKGGCTDESNGASGCLREYIDMENKIRLSYTFKTYVSQDAPTMENLISPSQQPDVILLATGAWDGYSKAMGGSKTMGGTEAGNATIALVLEMMDRHPSTDFVLATLVSCHLPFQKYAFAYNAEIRRHIPALDQRRVQLLDREPSTTHGVRLRSCEGWHAYGKIVLGHVDEFLSIVDRFIKVRSYHLSQNGTAIKH